MDQNKQNIQIRRLNQ